MCMCVCMYIFFYNCIRLLASKHIVIATRKKKQNSIDIQSLGT